MSIVKQTICGSAVTVEPLRLKVRRMWPADVGPLVPRQAEPSQPVEDAGDHVLRRALDVGVFDSKHEDATMTARIQPIEECSAGAADMQIASGGWCKSDARGHDDYANVIGFLPHGPPF